jgi:HK97 gp10 family phage protein
MAGLQSLAARLKGAADDVKATAALKGAQAGGSAFLRELQRNTPVLTGTLRRSERVNSVTGSGTRATASIGPHAVYARFRNFGGTITAKRARQLSNGHEFFGKSVTQAGAHYMDKTVAWADGGGLDAPVQIAVDDVLKGAGL